MKEKIHPSSVKALLGLAVIAMVIVSTVCVFFECGIHKTITKDTYTELRSGYDNVENLDITKNAGAIK